MRYYLKYGKYIYHKQRLLKQFQCHKETKKKKHFVTTQEATRKDVECAFGVNLS